MDNFCVPKKFNRHVVKALTVLHTTLVQSVFFDIESIVKQVERQMRRTKRLENIEDCVQKSLCSLTRLGVVARVGASDYALRQALQFSSGESAIPWKTVPKVPKPLKVKSDESVCKPKPSKYKVPVKPKKRKSKVKIVHPNRKPLCLACQSALKTFIYAYTRLKIGNG